MRLWIKQHHYQTQCSRRIEQAKQYITKHEKLKANHQPFYETMDQATSLSNTMLSTHRASQTIHNQACEAMDQATSLSITILMLSIPQPYSINKRVNTMLNQQEANTMLNQQEANTPSIKREIERERQEYLHLEEGGPLLDEERGELG